jgi:hypothetical protein
MLHCNILLLRANSGLMHRSNEVRARRARTRDLKLSDASPTPLDAQAFGKIAAEQMLPEMHELTVEIDPDLAAHVTPAAAEGIVLG